MNLYILIFILVVSLVSLGCSESNMTAHKDENQHDSPKDYVAKAHYEVIEPKYAAEIFIQEKGEEWAMSSSSPLMYEKSIRKTNSLSGSATFKKEEKHIYQTQFLTTSIAGSGRLCEIFPRFLRHDRGMDVWVLDLKYTKDGKEELIKSGIKISFDGQTPVKVMEDEYHTILVRPR